MERELSDNLMGTGYEPAAGEEIYGADNPDVGSHGDSLSDTEAEKALLSLCLSNQKGLEQVVLKRVVKDSFADRRNALIFEAISNLYINSGKVDRITVMEELEKMGCINTAGGSTYLFAVANTNAVISNIESYIAIVLEKAKHREFVSFIDKMRKDALNPGNSVNDLVDIGISRLTELREDSDGVGFESLGVILRNAVREIHSMSKGNRTDGIFKSGFRGLDSMLGGFRAGTLNILAARPGMGKTALVINIAINVARMYGKPVNIFSLEMSKNEIGNRIIAANSSITAKQLQNATLSKQNEAELVKTLKELNDLPIYIDDASAVTPAKMMSACKDLKARGQLGLVIVDYLQLMSFAGNKNSNRQEEVAAISRSLKVMAKDLSVPVIALSQLSRGAEKRDDHTPMLSDLRDSGAIEQDADSVFFIDRPDYYKHNESEPKIIQDAKIYVAKNRHGELGNISLKWWAEKTLFFEENRRSDPVDPQSTGMQSKMSSSANYVYDDPDPTPPPPEDESDLPFTRDDGDGNSEPLNESNEDFFADSHSSFPEGFE